MPKYSVAIARFPWQNQENPQATDWLLKTFDSMRKDDRIGEIQPCWRVDDTPITMGRNRILQMALERKIDYLLWLDSDMAPDCEPDGKPFWDTSFDFMLAHNGPCVVAAPYGGPPPHCNVYVFRWANWCNDAPDFDGSVEQFSREEAAARSGFERCAALPTGVMLIDVRALQVLPKDHPPTYYEWCDPWQTKKASTEDVTLTRDLALLGIPQYVNWDAWAGHWKRYLVRKPRPLSIDQIQGSYRKAMDQKVKRDESLVMVGEGQAPPPPARSRYHDDEEAAIQAANDRQDADDAESAARSSATDALASMDGLHARGR